MKKVLLGLLCIMWTFAGCGDDAETTAPSEPATAPVSTAGGQIWLVEVSHDPVNKRVYSLVEKGGVQREITVDPLRLRDWPVGISANISDLSGEVLFTLEVAWDESNPGSIWFREASGDDEMTGTIEQVGDRVSEIYTINGVVRSYTYPDIDPEARQHAVRFLYEDPNERIKDPGVLEYIDVLRDFGDFYADNAPASLSLNPAGEILVKVLGDPNLIDRASASKFGGPVLRLDKRAQYVCGIAAVCSKLKCVFGGGWVNPLCIACAGTDIACTIAIFSCMFLVDCG